MLIFIVQLTISSQSYAEIELNEEIIVIGVTPTSSTGLPESKIPYNVQSATSDDIERSQSLSIADFLNQNLASISINEAQNNPLQPDVQYRGFTVSPLLGLAQGLAVGRVVGPYGAPLRGNLCSNHAGRVAAL